MTGHPRATDWTDFIGANIRGTPAMSAAAVVHDLRVLAHRADIFVMQEFRWPWYWTALAAMLRNTWRSFPSPAYGHRHPVASGQPIVWKRSVGRATRRWVKLLHKGVGGISEDRWLRAVLLMSANPIGLGCIYGTTHNVVHGDGKGDGQRRKDILDGDLDVLREFLNEAVKLGYPIVFELDGNIHPGTDAYRRLVRIVESHGGRFYGQQGVEFLFVIQGTKNKIEVRSHWTVPTSQIKTDHEMRGLTHRLLASHLLPE